MGTKVVERFGKTFRDVYSAKRSFFDDNDELLARAQRHAALYAAQPPRTACKACAAPLRGEPTITTRGVGYEVCGTCTHLNGLHDDTDAFAHEIYGAGGGMEYAVNYTPADHAAYLARRDSIYLPKVDFLLEVLAAHDVDPAALRVADIGAGAGYLLSAFRARGVPGVTGYEPGDELIAIARSADPDVAIEQIDLGAIETLVASVDADVLTFVGVLEHLQRLRETLAAVRANRAASWLYTSVPLFSPTVFAEAVFPDVMPRHLTGGHTHLFTDRSLAHLEAEHGLERVGAWWFGTDVLDHFRSVTVRLGDEAAREAWADMYLPLIDDLQLAIDRRRASSQVHLVYRLP